jgi:lysophospholipase L1-like esterase
VNNSDRIHRILPCADGQAPTRGPEPIAPDAGRDFTNAAETASNQENAENDSRPTTAGYLWATVFRLLRGLSNRRGRRNAHAVAGDGHIRVACLGSSGTDARGSYDWIQDLAQRPVNANLCFQKFAEGGDLAFNGLQRVSDMIACRPDHVVIMIGGNDVLALISNKHAQFVRMTKHLPTTPSPAWYRDNIAAIVQRLKAGTNARIALCSLTPIGEDPDSSDPFQAHANQRIKEYSGIVKDIAHQHPVSYVPVYETMHELMRTSPGRAYTNFRILPFYRDVFRQYVLRKSNNEIGQLNGWRYHRDGIHLNSRGGQLVADLVQQFLTTPTTATGSA